MKLHICPHTASDLRHTLVQQRGQNSRSVISSSLFINFFSLSLARSLSLTTFLLDCIISLKTHLNVAGVTRVAVTDNLILSKPASSGVAVDVSRVSGLLRLPSDILFKIPHRQFERNVKGPAQPPAAL